MPLRTRDRLATVTGALTVEDIEPLVSWLRATTRPKVNLRQCTHLHTGVFQALLHFRATVTGVPADPFLRAHLMPLLSVPANRSEP